MRATPGDTIVAVSTPPGAGAIAIVRLSGPRSLEIADAVFRGTRALNACPTHTAHKGRIVDREERIVDDVLATVMRAPNSYTTENMVEFGCHGGTMPARRVLDVCAGAGARLAGPGEFTLRAFLGGRLDLIQAEAVADIVSARTRRGLDVALGQLEGSLSLRIGSLRSSLIAFLAEVESLIDFSEDDIETLTLSAIAGLGRDVSLSADELLKRCELGMAVRDGVSVAIVGRPNVGKSSLMNALLMRDRSIVTASPGTTRDAVEDILHVEGVAVRLIDTAGWRDATEEAERAGVERARAAAAGADRTLFVLAADEGVTADDGRVADSLEPARTVVALNKTDLPRKTGSGPEGLGPLWESSLVCRVSALTGEGLDDLRGAMLSSVVGGSEPSEHVWLSNARHVAALRSVSELALRAADMVESGADPTLAAAEARSAAEALGEITGETTPEEVLERIFERFCVGK